MSLSLLAFFSITICNLVIDFPSYFWYVCSLGRAIAGLSYGHFVAIRCKLNCQRTFKKPLVISRRGYLQTVAYPGIFFGGGSTNSVEDRGDGDGGVVAP